MTRTKKNGNSKIADKSIPKITVPAQIDAIISDSKTQHKEKENITINITQEKSNQPKIANWIAAISAVISLGLGVITLLLFLETKKATQSSADAATVAQKTFEETKKYNSASLMKQQAFFDNEQREFRISHQPYLSLVCDTQTVKMKGNNIIIMKYEIQNISSTPLKLEKNGASFFAHTKLSNDTLIKTFHKNIKTFYDGTYIGIGRPPSKAVYIIDDGSNTARKKFLNGEWEIYLTARFEYINYMNNKKRYYDVIVRLYYTNGILGENYILNENYDTK